MRKRGGYTNNDAMSIVPFGVIILNCIKNHVQNSKNDAIFVRIAKLRGSFL